MVENNNFSDNLVKIFQEFTSSNHHAFLIETIKREEVFNFFKNEIRKENDINESIFLNLKVFDIKKAKEILKYKKNKFLNKQFILLSFYSINLEAQNALLKFIEEAEENIKIILIIHKGANILSTIYSRFYKLNIVENISIEDNFIKELAKLFLKTKNIERMDLEGIKDILSRKDEYALLNEDKERGDREIVEKFFIELHNILFEKFQIEIKEGSFLKEDKNKKFLEYVDDILNSIKYIKNNSSSSKILFEYLSLKLPIIK